MGFVTGTASTFGFLKSNSAKRSVETAMTAPWKARNPRDFLRKTHKIDPFAGLLIEPQIKRSELQKENLKKQDLQQRQAQANARSQQRSNEEQKRKANAKSPNVAALLSAAAAGTGGVSSTLLSNLSGGLGGSPTSLGGRN